MKRDADALFSEQQLGDFLPRLAPLAQLADEIVVLWNGLPPRFRCAVSVITGQDSPIMKNGGREQVKVKVR
jgi:hypothetical protein